MRIRAILAFLLMATATSAGRFAPCFGQPPPAAGGPGIESAPVGAPTVAVDNVAKPAPYKGNDSCVICHLGGRGRYVQDFITMQEAETFYPHEVGPAETRLFQKTDKHALAFKMLLTKRGAQITDALGFTDTSKYRPGSSAHVVELRNGTKSRQCLSCHSNWRADGTMPENWKEYVEEGVSCEACHGPAEKWELPHAKIDWRAKKIEEKVATGLFDIRNPVERAKQCYSCHIGNAQQGKVVTHEMYAAGHPPLPGIEIETFATEMPVHWRSLREKGEFELKDDYLAANGLDRRVDTELPRSKTVVLGAVMAMRESLSLLADVAESPQGTHVWPELAAFDCQSCHHELRSPSWRQRRGYHNSPPGRVYPPAWPQALVKLGIHQYADSEDAYQRAVAGYDKTLNTIREAFDAQPFGDRTELVPAAQDLIRTLDRLAAELAKRPMDRAATTRALRFLTTLGPSDYPDYHTARQIVWAIEVIDAERRNVYPTDFPARALQRMKLGDADDETKDDRKKRGLADFAIFKRYLSEVRDPATRESHRATAGIFNQLRLRLPAGQGPGAGHSIELELPELMKSMSNYDPDVFRRNLKDYANTIQE